MAAVLATDLGTRLVLVHALPLAVAAHSPGPREAGERLLTELVEDLALPDVGCRLAVGDMAELLLEAAAHERAELIALGIGGRRAASRLRSVAQRALRGATCPVAAVPPDVASDWSGGPPGTHILSGVARDGDADCAEVGAALALALGLRLRLVHATTRAAAMPPTKTHPVELTEPGYAEDRSALRLLYRTLEDITLPVEGRCEVATARGRAGCALAASAAKGDAALVVVGSRRHGPLRTALGGSTARHLVRCGEVPVVVVPYD
jgi:nucleotide-binding universal stress UspA family protein